jgi:polar amino acid transport system substrate-binding protein
VALLLALITGLVGGTASGRPLDDIKRRGVISVCAHPNALPFASKRGERRGIQIELAEELARSLGVRLAVEWVTTGFHYRAVDCDIVMDAIVETGALQERHLRASVPYHHSGVALALRHGLDGVTGFSDLPAGAKVGVLVGSVAQMLLGRRGVRTSPFAFEDEMLEAVATGEIDAAAVTATSVGWYNAQHPDRVLTLVQGSDDEPELAWDVAVGMRRSDRFLRKEVDRIVGEMIADGTFARIYSTYGVEHRVPQARGPRRVERAQGAEEECIRLGYARECSPSR